MSVRIGKEVRHSTSVRVSGIPVRKEKQRKKETRVDQNTLFHRLFALDLPLLLTLIHQGHIKRAVGTLQLEELYLHARLAFQNAAATAVSYAALRTLLQTVLLCIPNARMLQGRVETSFGAEGTEVFIRCMFSARLGMLIAAALRFAFVMIRTRAERLKTEEERYAAASH